MPLNSTCDVDLLLEFERAARPGFNWRFQRSEHKSRFPAALNRMQEPDIGSFAAACIRRLLDCFRFNTGDLPSNHDHAIILYVGTSREEGRAL